MLKWTDHLTNGKNKAYSNRRVHVITISRGTVKSLEVFYDTEYLEGYFFRHCPGKGQKKLLYRQSNHEESRLKISRSKTALA